MVFIVLTHKRRALFVYSNSSRKFQSTEFTDMASTLVKRNSYSAMRSMVGALSIGRRPYASVAVETDILSPAPDFSLYKDSARVPLKDIYKVFIFLFFILGTLIFSF